MDYDVSKIEDPAAMYWAINAQNGKRFIEHQLSIGNEIPEEVIAAYNKAVRSVRWYKEAGRL